MLKGHGKGRDKEKKSKGKGSGKEERPAPNSSFPGHCKSCAKWGDKARESWQGCVQGVEELPSSSSGSTARSAGTTTVVARTAAVIHKVGNDEDETSWVLWISGGGNDVQR